MALGALEEVAALCHVRPVERGQRALAVVLAYLASRAQADRRPYDLFWRAVGTARAQERDAYLTAAINGIYAGAGRRRDLAVVSLYERRARSSATGPEAVAN